MWPFRDTAWVAIADGRIVAAGRSYQTSPTTEEEADLRRQHGEGLAVFDKPPLVEDAGVGVKR
ncbi:MAG: hypothetical protein HYV42_04925 [Candidatus Magasanikbacteria bacterium]|nr:hypothetical protein [Candidatus Magasanikbacteria bacterium]